MKYWAGCLLLLALLTACGSTPPPSVKLARPTPNYLSHLEAQSAGREILMYTLSLLGIAYQFGGTNPEAGLDCSGMVSSVYLNATGVRLPHNAARIASMARPIARNHLRVGDLVFFNTQNRPFSHVGIYIGDGKFVHAPRSHSVIRVERMDNPYFAARFDGARTLFN